MLERTLPLRLRNGTVKDLCIGREVLGPSGAFPFASRKGMLPQDDNGEAGYGYVLVNCTSAFSFAVAAPESMESCRQRQRISQMFGFAGCDQGGGGVQQDYIAPGRFLPGENFPNDGGVSLGVAT